MAEGSATAATVEEKTGDIRNKIDAGRDQVGASVAGVQSTVAEGRSESNWQDGVRQKMGLEAADSENRAREGKGAVTTASGNMRFDFSQKQDDNTAAKGLQIGEMIGDQLDALTNLSAGRVNEAGLFGNGGAQADLRDAQAERAAPAAVLSSGAALQNASTPEETMAAVQAYKEATGFSGDLPLDASTAGAIRNQMLTDFNGGRGAGAQQQVTAADGKIERANLAIDQAQEQQNRGGRQFDKDHVLGYPGHETLNDQKFGPGEDRFNLDLSERLIDIAKPTKD